MRDKQTPFSTASAQGIRDAIATHRDRLIALEYGLAIAKTPSDIAARVADIDLVAKALVATCFAEAANIQAHHLVTKTKD